MAEPDKRQIGDGSDNYGEAAKQMAKAAKEAGIETAKQAAVKGAEAGANAAAATVQAGVEGGKAVAEIAAGTAAGGPWGAILSAAWAMRHTLFKILVCICLFFLVIIVLIVSLPSVVTNSVFGLDGSMVDMENPTTLLESYNHLGLSGADPDPHARHHPHRGHDGHAAAAGGGICNGRGWRVAVSVHRPYHPFLDTPQEITLQEDRISLWPEQKEKETAEKKSLSLYRIICPSAT